MLAWIAQRCDGQAEAVSSPIGLLPAEGAIDTSGLDIAAADMRTLVSVDRERWSDQLPQLRAHLARFTRLPAALAAQLDALEARLADA